MSMKWLEWLYKNIWKYPNVNGFSQQLMPREKNGKEIIDEMVARIYVTEKHSETVLSASELISPVLTIRDGWKRWKALKVPTDVVEIKEQWALIDKTIKFRPMELGVAVGHYDISAGSLGKLYQSPIPEYAYLPVTNAHVGTFNPFLPPSSIVETRILNPAPYHDPSRPDKNIVGHYHYHKQIKSMTDISNCDLSNSIINGLNFASKLLRRKTRFKALIEYPINYMDFMLYIPSVDHVPTIADDSIDLETALYFGLLFAGSDQIGIINNVKYHLQDGWTPIGKYTTNINKGDKVKGCSFWCNYETSVYDPSATIQVNYGTDMALFADQIFVNNDGTIRGGWSGTGWYKV